MYHNSVVAAQLFEKNIDHCCYYYELHSTEEFFLVSCVSNGAHTAY